MQPSPRSPRTPSSLSDSVQHRLNLYALAASAAGVSVLALTPTVEAKVIYTKTYHVIRTNGVYPLDLNHDRTIDFLIQEIGTTARSGTNGLWVKPAFGNGAATSQYSALALKKGARIGPQRHFRNTNYDYGDAMVIAGCSTSGGCGTSGKWVNVSNRYLGLKFKINGETHYGWARLSVQAQEHKITATLTGYAYESIPKKAIHAGDRGSTTGQGPEAQPAALGRLALGAANVAVALRRRP